MPTCAICAICVCACRSELKPDTRLFSGWDSLQFIFTYGPAALATIVTLIPTLVLSKQARKAAWESAPMRAASALGRKVRQAVVGGSSAQRSAPNAKSAGPHSRTLSVGPRRCRLGPLLPLQSHLRSRTAMLFRAVARSVDASRTRTGATALLHLLHAQVAHFGSCPVWPHRFWLWWCDGLSVWDAFLWCGMFIFHVIGVVEMEKYYTKPWDGCECSPGINALAW